MMADPITISAITTLFLVKTCEGAGEALGEALMKKAGAAIAHLRRRSPEVAQAVEAGDPQAVALGTTALSQIPMDPVFEALLAAAKAEGNPTFQEQFRAVQAGGTVTIVGKQINITQGGSGNTQTNTFGNF